MLGARHFERRNDAMDALLHEAGSGLQFHSADGRYPIVLRELRFGELDFLIGALRYPYRPMTSSRKFCLKTHWRL
jgi:hypothetical protein